MLDYSDINNTIAYLQYLTIFVPNDAAFAFVARLLAGCEPTNEQDAYDEIIKYAENVGNPAQNDTWITRRELFTTGLPYHIVLYQTKPEKLSKESYFASTETIK